MAVHLLDDLDGVEVQMLLEEALESKLADIGVGACRSVGDIHDLVLQSVEPPRPGANGCLTSLTFYRLRRALREISPEVDWRPASPLALAGLGPRALRCRLASCGLKLPSASLTPPAGYLSSGLAFIAFWGSLFLLAVSIWAWLGSILTASAAITLIALVDRRRWPDGCVTAGDLARLTAPLNMPALKAEGAAVRPADAWTLVVSTIEYVTGAPRAAITPDARL